VCVCVCVCVRVCVRVCVCRRGEDRKLVDWSKLQRKIPLVAHMFEGSCVLSILQEENGMAAWQCESVAAQCAAHPVHMLGASLCGKHRKDTRAATHVEHHLAFERIPVDVRNEITCE
jgi:hypothetical protein